MNRVELVPTFTLMSLEWNGCPPFADEPGVEMVPTLADEPSGIGAHLQPDEPGVELVPP
jgi:hypothetical protein